MKLFRNTIFLVFIICSCNSNQAKLKTILIGKSGNTCWNVIQEGQLKYNPVGRVYCFYSNNKYEEFYYSEGNKKVKYDYGDQIFTDDWSLKNDSVLNMSGFEYILKKITKDSIILIKPDKEIMKLVLAKE